MAFRSKTVFASTPEMPPHEPDVIYLPGHFTGRAKALFSELISELSLRPDSLVIAGIPLLTKRLHDFRADAGHHYHYSGSKHDELPWTPTLSLLRDEVQHVFGVHLNSCLCNYYQDGTVGMGWHADKEHELGPLPNIVSVSLGATRLFRFRKRTPWREAKEYKTWNYDLADGDLLLMRGQTQRYFEHELAVRPKVEQSRLNLTFRLVLRTGLPPYDLEDSSD